MTAPEVPSPTPPAPPTLLVMAAGLGRRYGGLKQIEPVGPSGEWLLEYNLYDALRAGFRRVVFVVRESFREEFARALCPRWEDALELLFCTQEMDDLPAGIPPASPERTRPWGTAHAVWAAREVIPGPFAVLNADDYYGQATLALLWSAVDGIVHSGTPSRALLAGFTLGKTLSPHGPVSRGICEVDGTRRLVRLTEHSHLQLEGGSEKARGRNAEGREVGLPLDSVVSMNAWALPQDFLAWLETGFWKFLRSHGSSAEKEYYLPAAIQEAMEESHLEVLVQPTGAVWMGLTHAEDTPAVRSTLAAMHASGLYPPSLIG